MKRSEQGEWLRSYALANVPRGGARVRLLMIADGLLEVEDGVGPRRVSEWLEAEGIKLLPWQTKKLWAEE